MHKLENHKKIKKKKKILWLMSIDIGIIVNINNIKRALYTYLIKPLKFFNYNLLSIYFFLYSRFRLIKKD